MQIVVPMSGFGERFRRAGHTVPKPLIEVEGKPIIAHVIDLFPGEDDFVFVCNTEHLAMSSCRMRETLGRFCPTGRIVSIEPHRSGPVHAVREAYPLLDPTRPVIVNYCDFACYWDYTDFRQFVEQTECAGAIPAYRGFHPHSLGSNYYAYLREEAGWVLDIQEKRPFTNHPMEEFASSGTYYFASAALMKECLDACISQDLRTGDEFYMSLAYKPLLQAGRPVAIYELQHFMQWGVPEDLEEYLHWSTLFRDLGAIESSPPAIEGLTLLPMAGIGERFRRDGFLTPKPLLPVSGRPMFLQAIDDLPSTSHVRVVARSDLPGMGEIEILLKQHRPQADIFALSAPTDGQARTCVLGLEGADDAAFLTIGACDNGMLYNRARFAGRTAANDWDVIVWGVRGYPPAKRHPEQYGWISAGPEGRISGVSVKVPLDEPGRDPIIVGTFTFRHTSDFLASARRLLARDGRVNGEFYVDSCINDAIALGLRCWLFEIDHYLCWGTPDELRTFEYWQSCFHKWKTHPYQLENDARIARSALGALRERCRSIVPARPQPARHEL